MKLRSVTLPAAMVGAILAGQCSVARAVVGTPAPRWARAAVKAVDAPREWWWTDHRDLALAKRVEAPFRCPFGADGDTVVVRNRLGSLKSNMRLVRVSVIRQRGDDGRSLTWVWELHLEHLR